MKKQFGQSWSKNLRWKFVKSAKNPYVLEQNIQKKSKEITWSWTLFNITQYTFMDLSSIEYEIGLLKFSFWINVTFKHIMEINYKIKLGKSTENHRSSHRKKVMKVLLVRIFLHSDWIRRDTKVSIYEAKTCAKTSWNGISVSGLLEATRIFCLRLIFWYVNWIVGFRGLWASEVIVWYKGYKRVDYKNVWSKHLSMILEI